MCSLRIRSVTRLLPVLSARARQGDAVLHGWAVQLVAFAGQEFGTSLHEGDAARPGAGVQSRGELEPPLDEVPDEVEVDIAPPPDVLEQPERSAAIAHPTAPPRRPEYPTRGAVRALPNAASLGKKVPIVAPADLGPARRRAPPVPVQTPSDRSPL
jgi:hypothetical protein